MLRKTMPQRGLGGRWSLLLCAAFASWLLSGPASAQDEGSGLGTGEGAETLISGVVPDYPFPLCIQQLGDYDQAYVEANPAMQFQLGVTCHERGYTEYDRETTEALFDEPDKPGNGAYRLPAAPTP